ncbi:MAG: DUF2630 family protein [Carbonactinosporaceae bacterium]
MDDEGIHQVIKRLVDGEHGMRSGGATSEEDHQRLRRVEDSLDQCGDLLRQRQALRDAGRDPGAASPRLRSDVESYLQ